MLAIHMKGGALLPTPSRAAAAAAARNHIGSRKTPVPARLPGRLCESTARALIAGLPGAQCPGSTSWNNLMNGVNASNLLTGVVLAPNAQARIICVLALANMVHTLARFAPKSAHCPNVGLARVTRPNQTGGLMDDPP